MAARWGQLKIPKMDATCGLDMTRSCVNDRRFGNTSIAHELRPRRASQLSGSIGSAMCQGLSGSRIDLLLCCSRLSRANSGSLDKPERERGRFTLTMRIVIFKAFSMLIARVF